MEASTNGRPDAPEVRPPNSEEWSNGAADTMPWVRYRVEYRDATTGSLLLEKESRSHEEVVERHPVVDEPVFELVKTYKSRSVGDSSDTAVPTVLNLGHTKRLKIFSPAIVNALQSVAEYYPLRDLTSNPMVIKYPYAVLARHYDELKSFGQACAAKTPEDMCVKEEHAHAHLELLLKFLDDNIIDDVRQEQQRDKNNTRT